MKKPTSYFGGKSGAGTYQAIINQIPPHDVYVELFGGCLGIFRHKREAKSTIVIEKDASLIPFYRELGFWCYDYSYETDVKRRNLLYLSKSENGGKTALFGDVIEILPMINASGVWDQKNVFINADPPYPLGARKSDQKVYKYEMTDEEHVELLKMLSLYTRANVAISTYENEIYTDHFYEYEWPREWRRMEYQSITRHGLATETLWMNYPPPEKLHDYSYLGNSYRERERIARQKRRWVRKLADIAPLERWGLIEAMTAVAETGKPGKSKEKVSNSNHYESI